MCFACQATLEGHTDAWGAGGVRAWLCPARQATLEGHTGALTSVVLTGGGRFAVTAGEDCTARVWDLGNVSALEQVQGHAARITAVSASRRQGIASGGGPQRNSYRPFASR